MREIDILIEVLTVLYWFRSTFGNSATELDFGLRNDTNETNTWYQSNLRSWKEQEIVKTLLQNYSNSVRPHGNKPVLFKETIKYPVVINVTVWVLGLSSFNDVTMEFTAQLGFQQEWFDERLSFRDLDFKGPDLVHLATDQILWIPDTFFQNEQRGHMHTIDQPNVFKKVSPDGWVKYRKRLTMAFSCPMNLMLFPHDNQTCVIEFASYAYTTNDIVLQWSPKGVILSNNISESLPKFALTEYDKQICTSTTATGVYSCLRIKFVLRREFSYFLLQLYIPSCMLVSVSCVSFWIDWRSAPARVPLTIVTLLTITTQAHGINANLPPVSYTKAIDIWIGACVVFIFGSLIEYAIVNYIGSNEEKKRAQSHGVKVMPQAVHELEHQSMYKPCMHHRELLCNCPQPALPLLDSHNGHTYGTVEYSEEENNVDFSESESPLRFGLRLRFRRPISKKRRQKRDYQRLAKDHTEDGTGDCFDRMEYVEFRKKHQNPTEFRARRKRKISTWLSLSASMQKASRAEKIDIMSRILFPLGFVGFNIVYWSLYL